MVRRRNGPPGPFDVQRDNHHHRVKYRRVLLRLSLGSVAVLIAVYLAFGRMGSSSSSSTSGDAQMAVGAPASDLLQDGSISSSVACSSPAACTITGALVSGGRLFLVAPALARAAAPAAARLALGASAADAAAACADERRAAEAGAPPAPAGERRWRGLPGAQVILYTPVPSPEALLPRRQRRGAALPPPPSAPPPRPPRVLRHAARGLLWRPAPRLLREASARWSELADALAPVREAFAGMGGLLVVAEDCGCRELRAMVREAAVCATGAARVVFVRGSGHGDAGCACPAAAATGLGAAAAEAAAAATARAAADEEAEGGAPAAREAADLDLGGGPTASLGVTARGGLDARALGAFDDTSEVLSVAWLQVLADSDADVDADADEDEDADADGGGGAINGGGGGAAAAANRLSEQELAVWRGRMRGCMGLREKEDHWRSMGVVPALPRHSQTDEEGGGGGGGALGGGGGVGGGGGGGGSAGVGVGGVASSGAVAAAAAAEAAKAAAQAAAEAATPAAADAAAQAAGDAAAALAVATAEAANQAAELEKAAAAERAAEEGEEGAGAGAGGGAARRRRRRRREA